MNALEPDGSPSVVRDPSGLPLANSDLAGSSTSFTAGLEARLNTADASTDFDDVPAETIEIVGGTANGPRRLDTLDCPLDGTRFSPPDASTTPSYEERIMAEPRIGRQVHPASVDEATDRLLSTRLLLERGELHDEVTRLGIHPGWLDRLHREPTSVAIFEQLAPLALNFGALGKAGRPAVLQQTLHGLSAAADRLAENGVHDIAQGYLGSRHHVVTFHGITESFHVTVPGKETSEERKWFFTTGERNRFDAAGYTDLTLGQARLTEMRAIIEDLAKPRQNHSTLRQQAAANLLEDWDVATRLSRADQLSDGRLSFCTFVGHLNGLLAQRYGTPEGHFKTQFHDVVDSIATIGVRDWPLFMSKLLQSGATHPEDTVLRLRTVNAKGFPRYVSLHLEDSGDNFIARGDVILSDKDSKQPQRFSLRELVEQSQAAMGRGEGITLIPAAPICYWANFALGNTLGYLDGSVNARLHRVARAMLNPELTSHPRALTVAPYTELVHHVPADPHRPYQGIDEVGTILDYYAFAIDGNV